MAFQDTADTLRAKLHLSEMPKTVTASMCIMLVLVILCAGKAGYDAMQASHITVEKAVAAQTVEDTSEADSASSATESAVLTVHVVGAVANPGVYQVPAGSRVVDAVSKAGGLAEDADQRGCNMARAVSDGEQISIPSTADDAPASAPVSSAQAQQSQQSGSASSGLVNINTATQADLETLSGIGPSTAKKIVEDRAANGPFASKEDLKRVSGIGDKKYEAIQASITV